MINLLATNYRLLTIFVFFLLGLSAGSFLNVVSQRLLQGRCITGRSRCKSCARELAWHDLIPLLSFFFLRGRCRYCGAKLSWQYPLVELGTGLLFAAFYAVGSQGPAVSGSFFAFYLSLFTLLVVVCCLIVIFITDLLEQRVFDIVVWVGVVFALLCRASLLANNDQLQTIVYDLLFATGIFAFFWFLRMITRGRGMGEGDPALGFLCTLLVGFPLGVVMLFFAFTIGAAVGLVLVFLKKKKFGERLAFGPFLVVATFASLFVGGYLLDWYLRILGF